MTSLSSEGMARAICGRELRCGQHRVGRTSRRPCNGQYDRFVGNRGGTAGCCVQLDRARTAEIAARAPTLTSPPLHADSADGTLAGDFGPAGGAVDATQADDVLAGGLDADETGGPIVF